MTLLTIQIIQQWKKLEYYLSEKQILKLIR